MKNLTRTLLIAATFAASVLLAGCDDSDNERPNFDGLYSVTVTNVIGDCVPQGDVFEMRIRDHSIYVTQYQGAEITGQVVGNSLSGQYMNSVGETVTLFGGFYDTGVRGEWENESAMCFGDFDAKRISNDWRAEAN